VNFALFGQDAPYFVDGGCERDLRIEDGAGNPISRGFFTNGYPDRYLDSGERVGLSLAFQSTDPQDLTDVEVSLTCVQTDPDSPAECPPGSTFCSDPDRTNNPACTGVTIEDPLKNVGDIPAGRVSFPAFTITIGSITGTQNVEFLLNVTATKSGRSVAAILPLRTTLNADEESLYYSTDYPQGGLTPGVPYPEILDFVNDEVVQNPTTFPGDPDFEQDYRFESISWQSLQVTNRNLGVVPWNFEDGRQGWTVGLNNTSTLGLAETIANWGEDKNFNGVLDYYCSLSIGTRCPGPQDPLGGLANPCGNCGSGDTTRICVVGGGQNPVGCGTCNVNAALGQCISDEDRQPINNQLDDNWSTAGGCGWQTNGTTNNGTLPGGVWHTGRISAENLANCLGPPGDPGSCEQYNILTGQAATKQEFEMLLSPIMEKVNVCTTATVRSRAAAADSSTAPRRRCSRWSSSTWAGTWRWTSPTSSRRCASSSTPTPPRRHRPTSSTT
jgi:hypothetical protein